MKYGLMSYDYTINLGNEIQTIAARRFLPKIDYYIDHEKLNAFDKDNNVKLIMNGWFLDCLNAWPPSKNIDPLLISMHFSNRKDINKVIFSEESKDYLNEYGPVGCRDKYTVNFLKDNGIDAYFSGCLTLTLDSGKKYNYKDADNEYILINHDKATQIAEFLKQKTSKKIYIINQDFAPSFDKAFPESINKNLYNLTTFYNFNQKMFIAENFLRMYENASCIITDRLHCGLPSLALKTPVLLFNSRQRQDRFDGINDLFNRTSLDEYLDNYNIFDVDNPPENPKDYLKIRKDLIKKCEKFTGCVKESCYTNVTYNEMLDLNTIMISNHSLESRKYIKNILKRFEMNEKIIKKQKNEISKYKKEIENKNKIIDEYNNSISWKITSPLRKIKK